MASDALAGRAGRSVSSRGKRATAARADALDDIIRNLAARRTGRTDDGN
jgi:hypothetical protein